MNIHSFINGVIAGAGLILAFMSAGLLKFYEPLELSKAITTTEIRIAVFLGIVVFVIAIAYEIYLNGIEKKQNKNIEKDLRDIGNKNNNSNSFIRNGENKLNE